MSEEEKKENLLDKLNTAFVDFVGGAFGESGKDFIEDTSEKIKDFSKQLKDTEKQLKKLDKK